MKTALISAMVFAASSLVGLADSQPPVAELQVTSAFIWHVAHCDSIEEVQKFDATEAAIPENAKSVRRSDYATELDINPKFERQLKKILPEFKPLRAGLNNEVRIIKQEDLRGEQFIIVGLTPDHGRQKYFRIHIRNSRRPFVIDELEELTSDELVKIFNEGTLRIPQKKVETND